MSNSKFVTYKVSTVLIFYLGKYPSQFNFAKKGLKIVCVDRWKLLDGCFVFSLWIKYQGKLFTDMTPISSQKFFLSYKTWPLINFDGKQSFAILIASQTPEKPLQKANETITNFCILNRKLHLINCEVILCQ